MAKNLESTSQEVAIQKEICDPPPYRKTEVSEWDRFRFAKQILLGIFLLSLVCLLMTFRGIALGVELFKTLILIAALIIGYYFGATRK